MTRHRRASRALAGTALAITLAFATACGDDGAGPTNPTDPPSVNVTGTGEVQGAPDTLAAEIGVETQASDVTAAIEAANASIRKVTDAVVSAGVARDDVQTQQVAITPQYNTALPGATSGISGYQATNTLRVTVRDLSKASTVLGDAVAAGGNATRLSGVSFRIDDNSKLLSDARSRAYADARTRAEQYAKLSGDGLGRVLSITENVSGQDQPFQRSAPSASADAVPIEPGQQTVSVSVNIKWGLK